MAFKWQDAPDFRQWLRAEVRRGAESAEEREDRGRGLRLREHQRVARAFLGGASPFRGLLLYHGLGSGKSCAAVAAAAAVQADAGRRGRPVFVMLPASLRTTFESEIAKCARGGLGDVVWVATNGIPPERIVAPEENPLRRTTHYEIHGRSLERATVIVDEVHNLISQVVNRGLRGQKLFNAMYNTPSLKILALSGTPVINRPFELGMLLNLINGPVVRHVFTGVSSSQRHAEGVLAAHAGVVSHDRDGRVVTVELAPDGFAAGPGATLVPTEGATQERAVSELRDMLQAESAEREAKWLFPANEEVFNRAFLTPDLTRGSNMTAFMDGALGKVSHYAPTPEEAGMPRVIEKAVLNLPMSALQLQRYVQQREVEIEQERKQLIFRRRGEVTTGVYRAYTRAVSNFAFDDETPRVFPRDFREMLREMDAPDAGPDAKRVARARTYDESILSTRERMRARADRLRLPLLREHSPKFAAVLEFLQSAPSGHKALVYSQFRSLEGIALLCDVLDANGWRDVGAPARDVGAPARDEGVGKKASAGARKKASAGARKKASAGAREKASVGARKKARVGGAETREEEVVSASGDSYAVFDSADPGASRGAVEAFNAGERGCRVLFVSQSGAEGLNLRGVRSVHIVEPYWHEVRLQQVIGRAARTGSHTHLTEDQRVVDVYRYVASIPPSAAEDARNRELRDTDKMLSTDQVVMAAAQDKMNLTRAFLDALRRSAVDCTEDCHEPAAAEDRDGPWL